MTTTETVRKIRNAGFGYVCIERYDTQDPIAWGARAENLEDGFTTDDFYGNSISSAVRTLWKWIKENRREWESA